MTAAIAAAAAAVVDDHDDDHDDFVGYRAANNNSSRRPMPMKYRRFAKFARASANKVIWTVDFLKRNVQDKFV